MRSFLARAALVALVPTALVGVSPATAASAYHVTLSSSRVSLDYGQSLLLHGRVTGGPVRGRAVVLFFTRASQPDTWHRIGTLPDSAATSASGRSGPGSAGTPRASAPAA